jgi:hypothetical protein
MEAIDEVLAHGMHASIRNVEIRYEACQGPVGPQGPVVGSKDDVVIKNVVRLQIVHWPDCSPVAPPASGAGSEIS